MKPSKKHAKQKNSNTEPAMPLGTYENFPENLHTIARITMLASNKKTQQTLIKTFQKLNTETFSLDAVTDPSIPNCTVKFEFGLAEANSFNYLDEEEAKKATAAVQKQPMQTMDFLCAICYYKNDKEKKTPLRFDYYLIRFVFREPQIELRLFHEKGPRHTMPEDLTNFIITKINENAAKKLLKT